MKGQGFSDQEIANLSGTIDSIRAFDGLTSTIGMYDAGVSNEREQNINNVQEFFTNSEGEPLPGSFALTALDARPGTGSTKQDVHFGVNGLNPGTILHEALHIQTGLHEGDLAVKLGIKPTGKESEEFSEEIQNALHANGCF